MAFPPPTDHQAQYPHVIAQAVRAFLTDGHDAGAAALAPIAAEIWSERVVHGARTRSVPAQSVARRPPFNRDLAARVYLRDRFQCRRVVRSM